MLILILLLFLACAVRPAYSDEADFSDHITCYECEGPLNSTGVCSSPGLEIDKVLNQVTCVKGGCIKWAFYRNSRLMLVRTCSQRVNMSIYLQSACRTERKGNGFVCLCANDLCNSGVAVAPLKAFLLLIAFAALLPAALTLTLNFVDYIR